MKPSLSTLLLAVATAFCAETVASAQITRVKLTDPSSPLQLNVEIAWGSIRIDGTGKANEVTIEARPDLPDELASALIAVAEAGNVITVQQAPLASGSFRSANLEIRTPFQTSVNLVVTRGGDVWVRSVEGLVEVTNLNGAVELAGISGAAAVNASNGSIRAGFAEVDRERDMFFASLNGSIELCLPRHFSARVNLTTTGDPIRSDFRIERNDSIRTVAPGGTLTVDQSEVIGRIGSSEARLRVSTLNGEINLERCE